MEESRKLLGRVMSSYRGYATTSGWIGRMRYVELQWWWRAERVCLADGTELGETVFKK